MNCVNYRTFLETNANNHTNNSQNIITHADINFCDNLTKRQFVSSSNYKLKSEYEHPPENHNLNLNDNNNPTAALLHERFVNTLPARKVKKRYDIGAISIGPHVTQHSQQRMHVQQIFAQSTTTTATTITSSTTTTTTTITTTQPSQMLHENLIVVTDQQQQQQQQHQQHHHQQQQQQQQQHQQQHTQHDMEQQQQQIEQRKKYLQQQQQKQHQRQQQQRKHLINAERSIRDRVVLCKAPPPLPMNRYERSSKTKNISSSCSNNLNSNSNNQHQHQQQQQQQQEQQQRTVTQTPSSTPTPTPTPKIRGECPESSEMYNTGSYHGGIAIDTCVNEESELYFADVSSCCNVSVKNDNFYEEANRRLQQQQQLQQAVNNYRHSINSHHGSTISNNNNSNNEDYLHQRINPHENLTRTSGHNKDNKYAQQLNVNINNVTPIVMLQKDISHQSMYSAESEPKAEFTELSSVAPSSSSSAQYEATGRCSSNTSDLSAGSQRQHQHQHQHQQQQQQKQTACFVSSSFPRQTEIVHSYEARRLPTKQMTHEAHYEIVNDLPCQFNNVRLLTTSRAHGHNHAHGHTHGHSHTHAHAHQGRSNAHTMGNVHSGRIKRHHDLSALAMHSHPSTPTATTNKSKILRTPERTLDTLAYEYDVLHQTQKQQHQPQQHQPQQHQLMQHKSSSKERGSGNDERRRL